MAWRSLLKGDPMPWLLERSDPAVRAQTLRSLLDKSPRDPDLREAQQRAMNTPPISTILRRQKPDASWPGPNLYGPKYEGTHWANLMLVEYGVDPGDPRVRRAARYVLEELGTPGRGGMDWVFNKTTARPASSAASFGMSRSPVTVPTSASSRSCSDWYATRGSSTRRAG